MAPRKGKYSLSTARSRRKAARAGVQLGGAPITAKKRATKANGRYRAQIAVPNVGPAAAIARAARNDLIARSWGDSLAENGETLTQYGVSSMQELVDLTNLALARKGLGDITVQELRRRSPRLKSRGLTGILGNVFGEVFELLAKRNPSLRSDLEAVSRATLSTTNELLARSASGENHGLLIDGGGATYKGTSGKQFSSKNLQEIEDVMLITDDGLKEGPDLGHVSNVVDGSRTLWSFGHLSEIKVPKKAYKGPAQLADFPARLRDSHGVVVQLRNPDGSRTQRMILKEDVIFATEAQPRQALITARQVFERPGRSTYEKAEFAYADIDLQLVGRSKRSPARKVLYVRVELRMRMKTLERMVWRLGGR